MRGAPPAEEERFSLVAGGPFDALLEYGRLTNQHSIAFHRKWIEAGRSGEELVGSADLSSVSNVNSTLSTVRSQRFFPVDGLAVSQLVVAAALPLLAVVATQVPVGDMVQWILGKIL